MNEPQDIRVAYSQYAHGQLSLTELQKVARRTIGEYERSKEQPSRPTGTQDHTVGR